MNFSIFRRRFITLAVLLIMAAALLPKRAAAVLTIPDFVVYGTVAIKNSPVTNNPASTNVVIQITRLSDSQLLGSYQMGAATNQGKYFYIVRVPMEDSPASSLQVTEPDTSVVVTVKKSGVLQYTSTNIMAESSFVQRLDFGASVDTDGDGIPDGWELANRITPGLLGDADGDGVPDYAEYIAGTSPNDPNDMFCLQIHEHGTNQPQVSFQALLAAGTGYEGRSRYYALDVNTNFSNPGWTTVPNYSRVMGTNQTVIYSPPVVGVAQWFRARVWLEGP
jgi:hypothetical protein